MGDQQEALAFLTLSAPAIKPPTTTNSIRNFPPTQIAKDAQATNIVVHPRFPALVEEFLAHKRDHGSSFEKALYNDPAFTSQALISRLITNRPLTFMGPFDHTLLRDGTTVMKAHGEWDSNGTESQGENKYLTLAEYLSYDEIMLSSLIGVCGPSFFINDGARYNRAVPGKPGSFQERGVVIGLVGSRFERKDRMDSAHVLPTGKDSRQDPEVANMVQHFFAGRSKDEETDFDVEMYKGRTKITAEMLLLEANERARREQRKAYVYVVGLGLGVWQYYHQQREWYLETFGKAVDELDLANTSTVEFAWITVDQAWQDSLKEIGQAKGIRVIFSRRNPAEKLDSDELLVLSYAWDGNAFPGNEYWQGSLDGSGDPAAACMSTIPELHNPLINPFAERVRIAGSREA